MSVARLEFCREFGDTYPEVFEITALELNGTTYDLTTITSVTLQLYDTGKPDGGDIPVLESVGNVTSATTVEFAGTWEALPRAIHPFKLRVVLPDGSRWTAIEGDCEIV